MKIFSKTQQLMQRDNRLKKGKFCEIELAIVKYKFLFITVFYKEEIRQIKGGGL